MLITTKTSIRMNVLVLTCQQRTSMRMQVVNAVQYRCLSKNKHRKRYEPWFAIRNNLYQSEIG